MGNTLTNDASDKGPIPRVYWKSHTSQHQKNNPILKKWAKDLDRLFSKEDVRMTNRHLERCSVSLMHREIESEISPHADQNGYPRLSNRQQGLVRLWRKGSPVPCWRDCRLVQPLWKAVRSYHGDSSEIKNRSAF